MWQDTKLTHSIDELSKAYDDERQEYLFVELRGAREENRARRRRRERDGEQEG